MKNACYFSNCFSFKGLMLQDLISAQLISDYIIVEIPDSVSDLQGTNRVGTVVPKLNIQKLITKVSTTLIVHIW